MPSNIDTLRDKIIAGASLDDAALGEYEAHFRGNGAKLPELFRTYGELVEKLTDAEALAALRRRLVAFVDDMLGAEENEAVRGALRRRQGALHLALGDLPQAAETLAAAFRELPDEELLADLGERSDLDTRPELRVALLEARLTLAEDPRRRADAARRLGAIRIGRQQLGKAEVLFKQVLELVPDDAVAAESLDTIEGIRQGRRDMIAALRTEVDGAEDDAARSVALVSLAEALLEDPDAHADAFSALGEACAADPSNSEAAQLFIDRAATRRKWKDIARIGAAWLQVVAKEERFDALKVAGLALVGTSKHRKVGVGYLEEAHGLQPADAEVLDGLDAGLTAEKRTDDLVAALQKSRRATRSRADERRWLVREAEIVWRDQGDLDRAEKMFRRVRASEPRNMAALQFYEAYLASREDWKRLHAVLSQKFTLVEKSKRVDVAIQMAELAEHQMKNLDKAIEAYKRVLHEDKTNLRACDQLVGLYRKTSKWHALIEFLNGQIRRLAADDSDKKVALLFQVIDIYQDPEKLPVEEMVIHTYNRVVQISPTNVVALDNLAQRYEDARRWTELVGVLQKKIVATTEEDTLLDLFHQVADLYLSKMSNESQAIPFLERILEIDPSNLEVVRKLRGIYKAKHDLERLYSTYETELRLLTGKAREPVLTELAVLSTDKLYWHDKAIENWEALLDINSRNEKAVTSLYNLYAQQQRWEDYVGLLERRLTSARTKRKRVEILEKLGQLRFEKLGQIDEAKTVYRDILELNPHNSSARKALQKIHIAGHEWDELKSLYAEHQDWTGYIKFLNSSREKEDDPTLRSEIQFEIARVYEEEQGNKRKAVECLETLLEEDEADARVAAMLNVRYAALGAGYDERRLRVLALLADHADDVAEQGAALVTGVELLGRLDRAADAFAWARRVADLEVDEGRLGPDSVERLERCTEAAETWGDLAIWFGDAAGRVEDVPERQGLLRRGARLLRDRLRQNTDAIAAYEQLCDLDPNDWDALRALEELTRIERDWQGFESVLQRQIEALGVAEATDPSVLRTTLLKLGELYEDILDDPDQAVSCYQRMLALSPGDEEAVDGLDRIFQLEERWEDLLALLVCELERATEDSARVDLDVRIARLLYKELDDSDGAILRLEAALARDPSNVEAIAILNELFDDGEARERVGGLLDPVLRESGQHDRLVEVLTDRLARTSELEPRRELLADVAQIRERHMHDAAGAFVLRAEQVALAVPVAEARAELERLAEQLGRWEDVSRIYAAAVGLSDVTPPLGLDDVVTSLDDAADETVITCRLAEIYEAQLEDLTRATECYERVHGLEPENLDILAALERLHARREDWESLLAIYRAKVELTWEADDKKSMFLDICQLLREELGRPEDAIEYYQAYLALDEANGEVIGELEGLYARFERWDDLVSLLRRKLTAAESTEGRIAILFELAATFRDRLEDIDQALDTFVAILAEDPDHEDTIDAVEALLLRDDLGGYEQFAVRAADVVEPWLRERGHWQREVGVLRVRAELCQDDGRRASYLRVVGARYEEQGDDPGEAFEVYADAFRLEPGNPDGEAALERVAVKLQSWREWTDVLEDGVREDEPQVAVPLLLKVGALIRQKLEDGPRAIATYRRLLDLEPMHSEALARLDALYDQEEEPEERVSILERRAEIAEDEKHRRELLFEVGRIHEELGNVEDAIDGFAYVAEHGDAALEPIARDAMDRLQQLYEASEQWIKLVGVLLVKAEIAVEEEERKVYLVLAAETQEERLGNAPEAISLYERIREMDAADDVAFENLRRLLGDAERWDDLEVLLLDARARAGDDADANSNDFMLGQLYDYRLERPGDAIDRYEAILDRSPGFAAALSSLGDAMASPEHGLRASEILVRAYTTGDDAEKLAAVLTRRLEQWPGDVDISATHIQLAQLLEHRFNEPAKAFESLCQAALVSWDAPPELRAELVRLAGQTDGWDELELVDREVLGQTTDRAQRIDMLLEMARVARGVRQDIAAAEQIYREILDEDPGHQGALEALQAIFEETSQPRQLVEILRLQAEFAEDPVDKIAILFNIGAIQQGELSASDDAIDTYEQILAEDPQERDAYRQMELVYEGREDWDSVVGVLGRELDVLDSVEEVQQSRRRMAAILHDRVEDRDRALDAVTGLLEMDERDEVALRILESCHTDGHAYERVIRQLIPIYEHSKAWDKLIGLYRGHTEVADDQGKMWALEQIRAIQAGHLDDAMGAFRTLQEITRLVPEDHGRWAGLEDMAERLRRHAELVEFYSSLLDESPDAGYAVEMSLRAAAMCEKPLKRVDDAVRLYRFALDRDATNAHALAALSRLFDKHERWGDLVALKEHAIDHMLDAKDRRTALFDVARLYEERLGKLEPAAETLVRVLDDDPSSREALARLEGLFRQLERWEDVEDLYRRWLEVAEPPNETTAVRYRLAVFLVDQQQDVDGALEVVRQTLDEKRDHDLTRDLLERILEELPADSENVDARSRVSDLLELVYTDETPWEKWEQVYTAQLGAASDDEHQMLLQNQLGSLYMERAGDAAAAFRAYGAAFLLDYGNKELEDTIERLAEEHRLFAELAEIYEAGIDGDDVSLDLRGQYLGRLGELYQQLRRPEDSALRFEAVLDLDPANRPALEALDAYYRDTEGWQDLVRVLRLSLDCTDESERRIKTLYQLSEIELGHLQGPERAIEALCEVLDLDRAQVAAKDSLEALYGEREDWDALIGVYRLKLDFATAQDDRIELLGKTAQIQERMLQSLEDAVVTYGQILELSPQNLYAITSLERLYPQVADHAGLLSILERKRSLFRDPRDRAQVDFQMGALLLDRLGEPEQALQRFRLVLAQSPDHEETIGYLEKLLEVDAVMIATSFVLEPLYADRGDHGKLAHLIGVQLGQTEDPGERVDLLKRIADLRDQHLDDADGAIDALGQAFLLDPLDGEVRDGLKRVADRSERWGPLAEVYREALATIVDVDVTREVSGWLADLSEKHLDDPDAAIDRYREVLAYDEFNADARASLGRLLEEQERWEELVDVLRSELVKAPHERLKGLRIRLGSVLLDRVDDPEGALELFKEVLWEDPDDSTALESLNRIAEDQPFLREVVVGVLKPVHQGAERWDEVVKLLQLGIPDMDSDVERAAAMCQIAEIHEQRMGDGAGAFAYYREAIARDATLRDVLRRIETLAADQERWSELYELYEHLIKHSENEDQRRELLLKAGRIARTKLNKAAEAEARYREVLVLDPEQYEALDALEQIYEAQGKVRDLISVCEQKAALPIEVGERIALYRKIATAAQYRQDSAKAEASWTKLLDLDAGDIEALTALESHYREAGNYVKLADTMDRRAEVTEDVSELSALKVALGALLHQHMDDPRAAVDAYEEALELDESSEEALSALERLYEETSEWAELARILESRIQVTTDEAAQRELLLRLAGLEERHLDMVDPAIRHYERVLETAPEHAQAIDELVRIYHKYERWPGLVAIYERKLGLTSDASQRMVLLVKAAEVYAGPLANVERAKELVDQILAADPKSPRGLGLQAKLLTSEHSEDAIAAYERLLPTMTVDADKAEAFVNLGKLHLETEENTAKALVCFRDALSIDPDHGEASQLLKAVLYQRESWEALVPVLEREYGRASNRGELADIAHEIARLYRDRIRDEEEAYKWLRAAYNAKRDHRAVVEDLIEHYLEKQNLAEAAPLLAWLVSYLEAKRMYAELAQQSHRLGALFEGVGQPDKAMRYYQVANQYDSRNVSNLLALGRLLFEADKHEKALQTLQGLLLLQHDIDDDAVKAQMFLYLAKACMATGDKAKARRHLKRLLSLDKAHTEGNALLQKL